MTFTIFLIIFLYSLAHFNNLETKLLNENVLYNSLRETTFFKESVIESSDGELIITNGQKIGNIQLLLRKQRLISLMINYQN